VPSIYYSSPPLMCLWTSLRVPFIMPKVIARARISLGICYLHDTPSLFYLAPHLIVHLHLNSSLYCPLVTHSSIHLSRPPRVRALSIASLVQSCLAKHVVRMGDPYCSPPLSICAFTSFCFIVPTLLFGGCLMSCLKVANQSVYFCLRRIFHFPF